MRRRGYTLLEVLGAAAIGAVLLLATANLFGAALTGRARLRQASAESTAVRRAYEVVSRDMHCAVVPPDDSGLQFGLTASPAGMGANVLQFAAAVTEPMLLPRAANETALIQYAVMEDPRTGEPGFWRYETAYPVPETTGSPQEQEARPSLLLPGIYNASYLFYSAADQNWIESWDQQPGLPTAIRIDLALGPPDARTGAAAKMESWIFSLPAATHANEEAAAAQAETQQ